MEDWLLAQMIVLSNDMSLAQLSDGRLVIGCNKGDVIIWDMIAGHRQAEQGAKAKWKAVDERLWSIRRSTAKIQTIVEDG